MAVSSLVHRDPFFPFLRARGPQDAFSHASFTPNIDAVESDDDFRITAELPGLEEGDFSVEIEEGVLTLKGEKKTRIEEGEGDEAPTDYRGYRRVETRWGRFERRLRFGVEVDAENVKASYKNGVLEVIVPKVAEERPQVRTIPVHSS